MAVAKFTKTELFRLQDKVKQLNHYLPTLQMKKALLQVEVNKVEDEIKKLSKKYQAEQDEVAEFSRLFSHHEVTDLFQKVEIDRVITQTESIAGIEILVYKELKFKRCEGRIMFEPLWLDDLVDYVRSLKKAYQRIRIAEETKRRLKEELRRVSIRVNLFERLLIPKAEAEITQIKAFLGDLEIAQIAIAKVAKEKKLASKEKLA